MTTTDARTARVFDLLDEIDGLNRQLAVKLAEVSDLVGSMVPGSAAGAGEGPPAGPSPHICGLEVDGRPCPGPAGHDGTCGFWVAITEVAGGASGVERRKAADMEPGDWLQVPDVSPRWWRIRSIRSCGCGTRLGEHLGIDLADIGCSMHVSPDETFRYLTATAMDATCDGVPA